MIIVGTKEYIRKGTKGEHRDGCFIPNMPRVALDKNLKISLNQEQNQNIREEEHS